MEKSSLLLSFKKEESSFLKKRSKRLFIIVVGFASRFLISIGWMGAVTPRGAKSRAAIFPSAI